jgi:ABC-type cobalamin/Fe3+-siderophores transport system ATPase subunit
MKLNLPPNLLCEKQQDLLLHNGVATLIGGNGSGKSCILRSIFDAKLNGNGFTDTSVVCFSSGQNEAFTSLFREFLAKERSTNDALNLEGFYFDKTWSKIMIFLATTIHSNGRVRQFLREQGYIEESQVDEYLEDNSTILTIEFKVATTYINQVRRATDAEIGGETKTLLQSTYYRSLRNFIDVNVQPSYELAVAIQPKQIQLTSRNIRLTEFPSGEGEGEEPSLPTSRINRHPMVGFFVQAADQDYFLKRESADLTFKGSLKLDHLSDGEFQILFLYSLFDLFDSKNTLFLLDEADSHLHFENIKKLWANLQGLTGKAVTTTHLLDSIVANDFESLNVVKKGAVQEGQKLKQLVDRLSVLSEISNVELEVCARIRFLALLDDYNDWDIFLRLCVRKGLDISPLNLIHAVKKTSSYGSINEKFGQPKIDWTRNLSMLGKNVKTEKVFLICDRDEAPIAFDGTGVVVCGEQYKVQINELKWPGGKKNVVQLLAWQRREIKNYLLSFTALSAKERLPYINNAELPHSAHLKKGDPGDYPAIRNIEAKTAVDPLINSDSGLCHNLLQAYVDLIPPEEISIDIVNMHAYIIKKLS